MPDWSYHPLKVLMLNKLSPTTSREFIHRSMSYIASIPGGRNLIGFLGHMKPPLHLKKEINDVHYCSPVGLSSSIDPNLSGTKAFQELGFGFIEIGPIVLTEPKVQDKPIRKNDSILFSENPEKVSLRLAIKQLTRLDIQIPIFAKIDTQVTKSEWNSIVQHLAPFVNAFIGTSAQIKAYVDQNMMELGCSFYLSMAADEVLNREWNTTELLGIDGVVISASYRNDDNYFQEVAEANTNLSSAVKRVTQMQRNLTILTSGGVEKPDEALSLIDAGADLVMVKEGYVKAGPGLPKRIHERVLYEQLKLDKIHHNWYWSFLFGLSILIGGFIALYFALTSIILPYDESFIGLTRAEILQVNPLILSFMSHDRMALAGTMISGGILYIQLARHGIKNNLHWTKVAFHSAAIIGFLGIFLFIGYGYFDWLHGLFWLVLLPIYYSSFKEGKRVTGSPCSSHGENDRAWRYGLYGQFLFIMQGFMIIVGGFVISAIGVSKVFVTTDLSFLCMSPQMLDSISNQLIPVIAHDRAGFGSALISVGLLVLMVSLWGFRKGERWVWNTLALGALPAFLAGIGTHLYIGYTTFIHLLPVYFLVLLYLLGLVFSFPFLKKK
ncbi:beta/alpha barrel domain-containing protein [Aquibacillus kalidii]|uniref:dihydroorotate dehydrogenase n=1 Tax=Aquibacillus kalidii TaxID=2762597 RepID=UPI0016447718|nr:dihydroorotate dehydrogenase [Aquibacillus kalidii]